jgi:hypothetical protein
MSEPKYKDIAAMHKGSDSNSWGKCWLDMYTNFGGSPVFKGYDPYFDMEEEYKKSLKRRKLLLLL